VNLYGYVGNNPARFTDPSGKFVVVPFIIAGVAIAALIAASPSTVNAPGPGDPVYRNDYGIPVIGNAIGGAVGGAVLGKIFGPVWSRFMGTEASEICELGISGGPSKAIGSTPKTGYAPNSPLPQQNVGGVDIPTPLSEAVGPHTTLGTRVGSDGIPYRQSATFPGESFPQANGQSVPWSRVDWTNHGRGDHFFPHQHPFLLQSDGTWKMGSGITF
jgi:hypothetical protein